MVMRLPLWMWLKQACWGLGIFFLEGEEIVDSKSKTIKILLRILPFCIFVLCLLLTNWFQKTGEHKKIGYILSVALQLSICPWVIIIMIKESVNRYNKNRKLFAFGTNICFIISSVMFLFNNIYLTKLCFQILSLVVLIIMLFIINHFTKIEKGNDLSLLKSINYIMVSIFIATTFILEKYSCNGTLKDYINIYQIVPLLMLQGLYEALDGRAKQLEITECKDPSDCQKTPESQPTEYELDFPLLKGQDVKLVINPKK